MAAPSAAVHNRVLRAAEKRARELEPRLVALLVPILRQAGDVAAANFEARATRAPSLSLTAAANPGFCLPAEVRTVTDPVRRAVIDTVAKSTVEAAGMSWDATNPFFDRVVQQFGGQITYIAKTTQLDVMRAIDASYKAGLSIPDTAKAIRTVMTETSVERATLIARTEMTGAVNAASLSGMQFVQSAFDNQPGGPDGAAYEKQWATASGAKYPRHELYDGLDGQTVGLNDSFEVGDDELQHPGDPSGSPEEVCNCRCAMVYLDQSGGETGGAVGGEEGDLFASAAPCEAHAGVSSDVLVELERLCVGMTAAGAAGWSAPAPDEVLNVNCKVSAVAAPASWSADESIAGRFTAPLTVEERTAVDWISGAEDEGNWVLNGVLRGGGSLEAKAEVTDAMVERGAGLDFTLGDVVSNLDSAIEKSVLDESATLYRGVSGDTLEAMGLDGDKLHAGQTIVDKGYGSLTDDINTARDFTGGDEADAKPGFVFEIHAEPGAHLMPVDSALAGERNDALGERLVLLPRDAKLRIDSVTSPMTKGGVAKPGRVKATLLPSEPKPAAVAAPDVTAPAAPTALEDLMPAPTTSYPEDAAVAAPRYDVNLLPDYARAPVLQLTPDQAKEQLAKLKVLRHSLKHRARQQTDRRAAALNERVKATEERMKELELRAKGFEPPPPVVLPEPVVADLQPGGYDVMDLPPYARRSVGEIPQAEAAAERKKLVALRASLKQRMKNAPDRAADYQRRIDATNARVKELDARIKEPPAAEAAPAGRMSQKLSTSQLETTTEIGGNHAFPAYFGRATMTDGRVVDVVIKPQANMESMRQEIDDHEAEREAASSTIASFFNDLGFRVNVPDTALVKFPGSPSGLASVQTKIESLVTSSDDPFVVSTEALSDYRDEVERASLFDYVIGNLDRHGGNFGFNEDTGDLWLFDHGLTFPQSIERRGMWTRSYLGVAWAADDSPIDWSFDEVISLSNRQLAFLRKFLASRKEIDAALRDAVAIDGNVTSAMVDGFILMWKRVEIMVESGKTPGVVRM